MKGHVPTPPPLASKMVETLFYDNPPEPDDRILYPGMGTGPFVTAVETYCNAHNLDVPSGVGIELDQDLVTKAKTEHSNSNVTIKQQDFLDDLSDMGTFDYIIGNPPYVPIEGLNEDEKTRYRETFTTATGRFDLYLLFFEQALDKLAENGKLVFITPEKFEYVDTAEPLRKILAQLHVKSIEHIDENSFERYITYPAITTLRKTDSGVTNISRRDGVTEQVRLPTDGDSWATLFRDDANLDIDGSVTLGDICQRISCGVATGADKIFVEDEENIPDGLKEFTYPTVGGRQLSVHNGPYNSSVFISPYDDNGNLRKEQALGAFGDWAELQRDQLEDRSCVEGGKKWYAWHETPQMQDLLQPKIVWKDVSESPQFWDEPNGTVVPKHSVYYLIPNPDVDRVEVLEYLNSPAAHEWLEANCQHAANGYLRLQSSVLKKLPVPKKFANSHQQSLTKALQDS